MKQSLTWGQVRCAICDGQCVLLFNTIFSHDKSCTPPLRRGKGRWPLTVRVSKTPSSNQASRLLLLHPRWGAGSTSRRPYAGDTSLQLAVDHVFHIPPSWLLGSWRFPKLTVTIAVQQVALSVVHKRLRPPFIPPNQHALGANLRRIDDPWRRVRNASSLGVTDLPRQPDGGIGGLWVVTSGCW